ncbi:hypothetical protein BD833_11370 [Blastococcus xanthinilyticus]|uniref:Uncharacterized protein n=1 Tax=Blastococcus xanthinilyticus TaxID=1564164 RepID=A0A5S5CRJ0_9ACTN|nr:hypothetical protein BD833_11370 [Blastococcus xanthinilyticus]
MVAVLAMLALVAVGVGLAHLSWAVLGPLLAGRSDVFQGILGAVVGAAAAAPALKLLSPQRRPAAMGPVLSWLLVAAVCFLWAVPFRRGNVADAAEFQAQTDTYVAFSVLVFLVATVVLLRRVPEEAYRPMHEWLAGDPPPDDRASRRGR